MASTDRLEIRSVIKFCQQLGETPTNTYKKIITAKGKDSVSRTLVFDWHRRFKNGEESIEDRDGRGRKRKITSTSVTAIADALRRDRRLTVRALADEFDISVGSIHSILINELKMTKVILIQDIYF